MKNLIIYIYIYLSFIGCTGIKNTKNQDTEEKSISDATLVIDSLDNLQSNIDSKTIDTLQMGATFFKYDAFVGYKYMASEPYEFIELNNEKNSTQIMIYLKSNIYYAILVSAEDNVEKYDSDWEKLSKKVNDIVTYDAKYELCWFVYDSNHPPKARFGIGLKTNQIQKINEYSDCEIYTKHMIFDVDYRNSKIQQVHIPNDTFCCSNGY